ARQRSRVDGAQRVGPDAHIVLIVELGRIAGGEPMTVEPGPAPLDCPEELSERRHGDYTQKRLASYDQTNADGPKRQAVDHVGGAVDGVDRPPPDSATPLGAEFLAGEPIIGKPRA